MEALSSKSSAEKTTSSDFNPGQYLFLSKVNWATGSRVDQKRLVHGYIRLRGEMADYTTVGLSRVHSVLREIGPFVILKAKHVEQASRIIDEAQCIGSRERLLSIARQIDAFAVLNYSKTRHITSETVSRST